MRPASPFVVSPARGVSPVALRGAFALLLALLVTAVVDAQPTADAVCRRVVYVTYPTVPVAAQPPKKEADKKEPDKKEPTKPPEPMWPTDLNGKDIKTVMKDLEDPDPVNREFAARSIAAFGPPARKEAVSKLLLKRMNVLVETDPGVRFAVYSAVGSIPFENEADNNEALRILIGVIDNAPSGSSSRYQAVQTIAMFGPRGEGAILALAERIAKGDASYETRRTMAGALGRIAFHETAGPNMKAMVALADHYSKDPSAAVRMEALQSLMLLGPPWAEVKKKDAKGPPAIKTEDAARIVKFMKARVGDPTTKPKPTLGLEKDKQVEIWARLVMMRFDPKEINDDNLDAFAKHLTTPEVGVKVQALQAIGMIGEAAGKKVDAVARLLSEKNQPMQLTLVTVQTLASMGAGAKPAIKDLKELATEMNKSIDKMKDEEGKMKIDLAKIGIADVDKKKETENALKAKEYDRKTGEEIVKLIESVIKHIDESKPMSPSETPKKP